MALTIAGIQCLELARDFSESLPIKGGPHAEKSLLCDWGDRYTVANALVGASTVAGGSSGLVIFTNPYVYPESANMIALDTKIQGVGAVSQGSKQIAWDKAIITITYGLPPYNTGFPANTLNEFDPATPIVYCSQSLDYANQVITIPRGKLKIAGTTRFLQQPLGIPVNLVSMNLVFHRLPYMVPLVVRNNVGSMNSAPFLGCATGTILFDGLKTSREFNNDGSVVQETSMSLVYRPQARWDEILDPDAASRSWVAVTYQNGDPIVPSFDMSTLIPNGYHA